VRRELPELPAAKRSRYVEVLGVAEAAAEVLTQHPAVAAFFEEAAGASGLPVKAANFVVSEVLRDTTTHGMAASFPVTASQVAGVLRLVEAGTISGKQAKAVYGQLVADARGGKPARTADEVVRDAGMAQVTDDAAIEAVCRAVLDANPRQAAALRGGKGFPGK